MSGGIRLHPRQVQSHHYGSTLRAVKVGLGLPGVEVLKEEFSGYVDVLVGRTEPPIDYGVMTLMECADAYFARACEVDALIHEAERESVVLRGDDHYRFRTGYLRSFLDLAKRAAELGSRRLTYEQLLASHQRDAQRS